MDATNRAEFVSAYTKVLTSAWSDDAYRQRLQDEPKAALAENGLAIPEDASVSIVDHVAGEGTLEDQVALWSEGESTGRYRLYVPDEPQIETAELSESDLETVAGGDVSVSCCCCTPSCSCT